MRRITITVEDGIDDETALERLLHVVKEGKVSRGNNKDHYCWLTAYHDGIMVHSKPKYGTDSDRFLIYKQQ